MTVDRNELKSQALLQRIAELTNESANYRVEITVLSQELQETRAELEELKRAETEDQDPTPTKGK